MNFITKKGFVAADVAARDRRDRWRCRCSIP